MNTKQVDNYQQYVCGFAFYTDIEDINKVLLIKKNKPEWQVDKLNGIGGKIESQELALHAMTREFKEETGILHTDWTKFTTIVGKGYACHFYYAHFNEIINYQSITDEEVLSIAIDDLAKYPTITNLQWLIPLAYNSATDPYEEIFIQELWSAND